MIINNNNINYKNTRLRYLLQFSLNIGYTNIQQLILLFIKKKKNHSDLRQRSKYYTEKLFYETNCSL